MITKILGERRGFFFGFSSFIGGLLGIVGAMISFILLEYYVYPYGFIFCFIIAFTLTFMSWIFVSITREPSYPTVISQNSLKDYLWKLPEIFRKDRNFTVFLVAMILTSFTSMANSFYTVYAIDMFNLVDSDIALFTLLLLGSRMVVGPLCGYFGDRKGHKIFVELGVMSSLCAILIATFANSRLPFCLIFTLMGVSISVQMVSQRSIVPDFCTSEERPIYLSLSSTVQAPFIVIPPILGGLLVSRLGYPIVFLFTAIIVASGLGFLHLVREPRQKRI